MYDIKKHKEELAAAPDGVFFPELFRCRGYEAGAGTSPSGRRADGIEALFVLPEPFIYKNDLIAGSIRSGFVTPTDEERESVGKWYKKYPERGFIKNGDHYAPGFAAVIRDGIPGLLSRIDASAKIHSGDGDKLIYLDSMKKTLRALQTRLLKYASKAGSLKGTAGYDDDKLDFIEKNCKNAASRAPQTFAEGLQLVWMIHNSFSYEGRYAMALGRIDQYLYPLYKKEKEQGTLDDKKATELLANTFIKICENRLRGFDDVVNICIGGVDRDGVCAVNDLSYCVLYAVRDVNLPGPNLSARITEDCPDKLLDECLKVIGTGLGYPALMNDTVNMAALLKKGYELEDVRDYCMVGCIENFLPGKQPPWVDGRFDPIGPLLELINECADGDGAIDMDAFMEGYRVKLKRSVKAYIAAVNGASHVADPENHTTPFLSCFCDDCIERGLDINMGGSKYRSAHGAGLIGIGTVSDSLAAIEKLVFVDKKYTLRQIKEAMERDFHGFEDMRGELLDAPKYGNNDDFADKYAVFYNEYIADLFDLEQSHDGGRIYTAMASNVSNIYVGKGLGATPDGRLAGTPLSDAASPGYGRDKKGVTSTLLSVSKPDYTRCACGTVVNQKFSPSAFKDGSREKLAALVRVYFKRGGQEIQINATSRQILRDAMEHPEEHQSLVVRVSGFSALYITLAREVQEDILARTQHEEI